MAKKINTDELNESLIIASVRNRTIVPENSPEEIVPNPVDESEQPEQVPVTPEPQKASPELPKEDGRRKRKSQDYESMFVKESNITARLGKTVYIRKEHHDRILKIVQVIGANEVSLFSYIDNIIIHHFDMFQDDISQAYKQKVNHDIF